jgi:hypothetical protein
MEVNAAGCSLPAKRCFFSGIWFIMGLKIISGFFCMNFFWLTGISYLAT